MHRQATEYFRNSRCAFLGDPTPGGPEFEKQLSRNAVFPVIPLAPVQGGKRRECVG